VLSTCHLDAGEKRREEKGKANKEENETHSSQDPTRPQPLAAASKLNQVVGYYYL